MLLSMCTFSFLTGWDAVSVFIISIWQVTYLMKKLWPGWDWLETRHTIGLNFFCLWPLQTDSYSPIKHLTFPRSSCLTYAHSLSWPASSVSPIEFPFVSSWPNRIRVAFCKMRCSLSHCHLHATSHTFGGWATTLWLNVWDIQDYSVWPLYIFEIDRNMFELCARSESCLRNWTNCSQHHLFISYQ